MLKMYFWRKRKKKQLYFENSRFLKSYLFKIIHLKLYESQREKKIELSIDDYENTIDDADNYSTYLTNIDKKEIKQQLFNHLNETEKKILTEVYFNGEKLKEIAQKLNISEANCRVIKHRALTKLEGTAKQMGYY